MVIVIVISSRFVLVVTGGLLLLLLLDAPRGEHALKLSRLASHVAEDLLEATLERLEAAD